MSLPHCVSSAALDIEHGREGGHFALQKRPHNLVAPTAVAHIATSQKGLACTPRDPKCGRFFFVFLDFGQNFPPSHFWPAVASHGGGGGEGGGGRGVQTAQPRLAAARNTPTTLRCNWDCSVLQFACHKSNFNNFHHSPMPQATFNSHARPGHRDHMTTVCVVRMPRAGMGLNPACVQCIHDWVTYIRVNTVRQFRWEYGSAERTPKMECSSKGKRNHTHVRSPVKRTATQRPIGA